MYIVNGSKLMGFSWDFNGNLMVFPSWDFNDILMLVHAVVQGDEVNMSIDIF